MVSRSVKLTQLSGRFGRARPSRDEERAVGAAFAPKVKGKYCLFYSRNILGASDGLYSAWLVFSLRRLNGTPNSNRAVSNSCITSLS